MCKNYSTLSEKLEMLVIDNKELKQDNELLKTELISLRQNLNNNSNSNNNVSLTNNNNKISSNISINKIKSESEDNNIINKNSNTNSDKIIINKNEENLTSKITIDENCFYCKTNMTNCENNQKFHCTDSQNEIYLLCKNCLNSEIDPIDKPILQNLKSNLQKNSLKISSFSKIQKFHFSKKFQKINTIKLRIFNDSNCQYKGNLSFFLSINSTNEIDNSYFLNIIEENKTEIIEPKNFIEKNLRFNLIKQSTNKTKIKKADLCFNVGIGTFTESDSNDIADEFLIESENSNDYVIIFSDFYVNKNIEEFLKLRNINIEDIYLKKKIIIEMNNLMKVNDNKNEANEANENEVNFYKILEEVLIMNKII